MSNFRETDKKSFSSRPILTINLSAIVANYQHFVRQCAPAKVAASVKADAYGLGIEAVGRALYGAGCRVFFVAHAGEGKILRAAIGERPNIYVLSGPSPQDLSIFYGHKLKPVINSLSQARDWVAATAEVKYPPRVALHFDTGINRLGIPASEVDVFVKDKDLLNALDIDLIMSHLACAGLSDHPLNETQLLEFKKTVAALPMHPLSLANTGGVYLGKPYHFQMVRPGIGLYGGYASDKPEDETVRPVVELHAPILQVKTVLKGQIIGYNGEFTAPKDMKVAIVSAGYADGIPTSLSGTDKAVKIQAKLQGNPAPLVGRVSMDYSILDITDLGSFVQTGEKAIFLGDALSQHAEQSGLINYEVLTGLGQRCKRVYIKDGDDDRDAPANKKYDGAKTDYKSSQKPGQKTAHASGQKSGAKNFGAKKSNFKKPNYQKNDAEKPGTYAFTKKTTGKKPSFKKPKLK